MTEIRQTVSTNNFILISIILILNRLVLVNGSSFLSDSNKQYYTKNEDINNRPIIGVLAQFGNSGEDKEQYIAASYIKMIEGAGGRAIPLFSGYPLEYYKNLMSKINGIVITGGDNPIDNGPWSDMVDTVLKLAMEFNNNGTYFPIWGTCLGFQKIASYFLGFSDWRQPDGVCNALNVSLSLTIPTEVLNNPESVRMFQDANKTMPNILEWMQTKPVSPHYHMFCLKVELFKNYSQLYNNFTLVTTNNFNNFTFVSTIEHRKYPFYAVAWHPEKVLYEFIVSNKTGNHDHSVESVMVAQYFCNFFINEARKNLQNFNNSTEEKENLIYNYNKYRIYSGILSHNESFEEKFIFPESFNFKANSFINHNNIGKLFLSFFILLSIFYAKKLSI